MTFQQTKDTNNINEDTEIKKNLPNFFKDDDELPLWKAFLLSFALHPTVLLALWLVVVILEFSGVDLSLFQKPDLRTQDIEFVLVTKEADPIDKNTKYRSDRNSRAGGIHDPKRKVSEPSPAPSPAPGPKKSKQQPAPAPYQPQKQTAPQAVTTAPAKPSKTMAPKATLKPSVAPSGETLRPQMPKISQNPKSPFSIEVPKTNLPTGPVPSTSNGTAKTGGGQSSGIRTDKRGVGMPAPQFSTSKGYGTGGTGTGVGGGTGAGGTGTGGNGSGGYGTGGYGNPGPGNPSGPPGIDALKQPAWGPYMRELERRIKSNWNPPKGNESKRVVILFTVGRDGKLLSIKTLKSSGHPQSDQAAKSAIQLTAPFRSLPPEFRGNQIDIEFTFDYNVLGATYR